MPSTTATSNATATADPQRDLMQLVMRLSPCWELIDSVRTFAERFCEMARLSPDRASQLALAVHELMQNAIQHGAGGDVELALCLDPDDQLSIAARNRCTREEYCDIAQRLDRLGREENTLAAYMKLVRETLDRPGGIGLARIRCEAQLELGARFDGAHVEVLASGPANVPDPVKAWEERGWLPNP